MELSEYKSRYTEDDTPGWDSIDAALQKVYGDQNPIHWAPDVHYRIGGDDPIDGISWYQVNTGETEYIHFVTYGFSSLYYDESGAGDDYSNFGFELTFRLKPYKLDEGEPFWVYHFLQNIARYVFSSEKWFEPFHHMSANGPIRSETNTEITALVLTLDPELGEISTPHGNLQFLQIYGLTNDEYLSIKGSHEKAEAYISKAKKSNPLLITNLERSS